MKESEKVYKKVGRKYEEIGWQWRGFPADGVWLVSGKQNSASLIMSKDEVKNVHLPSYARLMLERDRVVKALTDEFRKEGRGISPVNIYEIFATALAEGYEPFDAKKDEEKLLTNL